MNVVTRTCTELPAEPIVGQDHMRTRPLSEFGSLPAFVLLGDPGMGKTTSLRAECHALGGEGLLITARDFLALNPKPEWRDRTLFIDGLDEVRAGQTDARTPFDAIRRRLDALGQPRFRLSCRVADWLGANDRRKLAAVSPNNKIAVLRLEPLTDADLLEVVRDASNNTVDAQAFLARARECGIEPLLRNPQSLQMLAAAFAAHGELPASRRAVFDSACKRLILEHNEEHDAVQPPASPQDLLDAAGRLCAHQLIAGVAGYAIHTNAVADDYPCIRRVDPSREAIVRQALASKLFSSPAEGRAEPSHRQIAEYLGGRYLAKRIEGGLPPSRITALMTGRDGAVVTPLRGLSAWTAAHSVAARWDLIDRDPIGVGLYGDVQSFSLDEQKTLLRTLQRDPTAVRSPYDAAKAFGPLAAPGIEAAFRDFLTNPGHDEATQAFTLFLLALAAQGHPLPGLAGLLMQLVCDRTQWSSVNRAALDAFVHCCPPHEKDSQLGTLLEAVQSGGVRDEGNELLGRLLIALYPKVVSPRGVWDHLADSPDASYIGFYWHFWRHKLLEGSSDGQVAELLDGLVGRGSPLRQTVEEHHLRDLPARLLVRGLEACGERLTAARLHDWLGVDVEDGALLDEHHAKPVGEWLSRHPDRQKEVFLEGLGRAEASQRFAVCVHDLQLRLHHASPPPDWGAWCLKQAVRLDGERPLAAQYLLDQAFLADRQGKANEGLSEEILKKGVAGFPALRAHLEHLLAPTAEADWTGRFKEREARRQQQREEWTKAVRSHRAALIENRAPPGVLHRLARTYLGDSHDVTRGDGPTRLRENLLGDDGLTQAVLGALRSAPLRSDLPSPDQILQLYGRGEMHTLSLPFLAGLAEWERLGVEDAESWPEHRVRTALALRHCVHLGDLVPKWHQRLVELRPVEVAKAFVQIGARTLKQGQTAEELFWPLAQDAAFGQVAQHSCLPLLRAFPIRCRLEQLRALDQLLWAAVRHIDKDALREVAERKLSRKSMNLPQRIHWLAASRTTLGSDFQADLEASVAAAKDERGVRHLVEFLSCDEARPHSFDRFGVGDIEALLRLIGNFSGPEDEFAEGLITAVGRAAQLSQSLINHLAASPQEEASSALARLSDEPALSRWRKPLRRALESQRVVRRDSEYRHPTISQVQATLNQGPPANAADLAALVADRLRTIARKIRHNNTDDWRQYWNLDPQGRPTQPRHEDACRDALLSDLRQHLPPDVAAEPEGHQANDNRADIVVAKYRNLRVPVEAKRSQNPGLWSALKTQLIAKYAADGPGIYLVFWFGADETPPPPHDSKPRDPASLEERLRAQLSPEERRRVCICAIDVQVPSSKPVVDQ